MISWKKILIFTVLTSLITSCGSGSSSDIEYFALGASDAVGIGATPLTNGYVYLIEEKIEAGGMSVELENLGLPGAEIDNIDNLEVPFLERDKPELITLFTGPNDLIDGDNPQTFESDLQGLFNKILAGSEAGAIIAVANIPDLTKTPRFIQDPDPDVTLSRINAFNAAIARQTAVAGGQLVNLFNIPVSASLIRDEDGFHPNDEGHRIIADAFLAVILPIIYPSK